MFTWMIILAVTSWIWSGLKKLPVGWRGLVLLFGKRISTTVEEGWNCIPWPWDIQLADCRQVVVKLDEIDAITKDNVVVKIKGSLIRKITDLEVFFGVKPEELKQGLDDIWDEIIRSQVRDRDLEEVLRMHVELGDKAKGHLHDHTEVQWGITIVKVVLASIMANEAVTKDLELKGRKVLQRTGQRVQANHFADLVNFFSGNAPLETGGPAGPGLSPELAYEAALIQIDKAEQKKLSSNTFGLDAASVKAIVETVLGRKS